MAEPMDLSEAAVLRRAMDIVDTWYQRDLWCHDHGHRRQWCCSKAQDDMRAMVGEFALAIRDAATTAERERCAKMAEEPRWLLEEELTGKRIARNIRAGALAALRGGAHE